MKKSLSILLIIILSITLVSCSQTYKLTEGKYVMEIMLDSRDKGSKGMTQEVSLRQADQQLILTNIKLNTEMTGKLEKDDFSLVTSKDDQEIIFQGKVTADNFIEGNAKQKKGDKIISARFKIYQPSDNLTFLK